MEKSFNPLSKREDNCTEHVDDGHLGVLQDQEPGARVWDRNGKEWRLEDDRMWHWADVSVSHSELLDGWPLEPWPPMLQDKTDYELGDEDDDLFDSLRATMVANNAEEPQEEADVELEGTGEVQEPISEDQQVDESQENVTLEGPQDATHEEPVNENREEALEESQEAYEGESPVDTSREGSVDEAREEQQEPVSEVSDKSVDPFADNAQDEWISDEEEDTQGDSTVYSLFVTTLTDAVNNGEMGKRKALRLARNAASVAGFTPPSDYEDLAKIAEAVEDPEEPVAAAEDEEAAASAKSPRALSLAATFEEEPPASIEEIVEEVNSETVGEKKGKKVGIIAGALAALLIAGGVGGWVWWDSQFTTVPRAAASSITEQNVDPCKPFIDAELKCEVDKQFSDTKVNGSFLGQSVEQGEKIKKNTLIKLNYSLGPEKGVMDDLAGKTFDEVKKWMADRNLIIGTITESKDSTLEADRVARTSVLPGEEYSNGQKIDIVVSAGSVKAPDWTKSTKEVIAADAAEKGLDVTFVEQESDAPVGSFISQTPNAGEPVVDNKILVTVAKAKEATKVTMPDVIGKSKTDAETELMTAGYTKVTTVVVSNSEVTEEKVTQTVPEAGAESKSDDNIVVIVSKPVE